MGEEASLVVNHSFCCDFFGPISSAKYELREPASPIRNCRRDTDEKCQVWSQMRAATVISICYLLSCHCRSIHISSVSSLRFFSLTFACHTARSLPSTSSVIIPTRVPSLGKVEIATTAVGVILVTASSYTHAHHRGRIGLGPIRSSIVTRFTAHWTSRNAWWHDTRRCCCVVVFADGVAYWSIWITIIIG